MEIQDYQYSILLGQLGYTFKYHENKRMFQVDSVGFFKVCEDVPSDEILRTCLENKHNHNIVLLNGNVSFKHYQLFPSGSPGHYLDVNLIRKGDKYAPFYFGEYDLGMFTETDKAIAISINNGEDISCLSCGLVNDFTVHKPSKVYTIKCSCGRHIRNITDNKPVSMPFGKFKGMVVSDMKSEEELSYLRWVVDNQTLSGRLEEAILRQIS